MEGRRRAALGTLLGLVLGACGGSGVLSELPAPGRTSEVEVKSVTRRSAYLDAVLVGEEFSGRLFFVPTEECTRIVSQGARIVYARNGPWGEVRDDAGYCYPTGIAELRLWRDAQPKPRRAGQPRGRAQYQIIFADTEVALARGRFPLAAAVGWTPVEDTIAVIPRSEACRPPLERGVAFMEYRATGPDPLLLISAEGPCPIVGFIRPEGPP